VAGYASAVLIHSDVTGLVRRPLAVPVFLFSAKFRPDWGAGQPPGVAELEFVECGVPAALVVDNGVRPPGEGR
jgi:hypothetical protein